jgi:nucleotide-binding universal stress UspA family protein
VIVGIDGRAGGRDAVALARVLVAPRGRLTLAHVRRAARHEDDERRAASLRLLESERERAEVVADLESVEAPSVARGLHELAARRGVDLLAVGSCARGFAGRVLLGNDTRATMGAAPCPVAVAPAAYARDLGVLRTVGIGYDGSPGSRAAVAVAREFAEERNAAVRALEVVQLPSAPYAGVTSAVWAGALDDLLADAGREMDRLDGVEGRAVIGVTDEELAAFSRRVDLLVVGSGGPRSARRLALGSTLGQLVAHASCPLLVLPRAGEAAQPSRGTPLALATAD